MSHIARIRMTYKHHLSPARFALQHQVGVQFLAVRGREVQVFVVDVVGVAGVGDVGAGAGGEVGGVG